MSKKKCCKNDAEIWSSKTKNEIMLLKDPLGMYHSFSFAEDDKLRPGEDVTSTSQGQKFQKFEEYPKSVRIKMADLAGR